MPVNWSRFLPILICVFWGSLALAQPKDNSPYSRLGLGDLVAPQFGASLGMGGLSAAFIDPYHLNLPNPASLAFMNTTAFDVGIYAKYANLKSGDETSPVWSGNLNYLALGFPLRNPISAQLDRSVRPFRWGMALSLQPFTNVDYDVQVNSEDPVLGATLNNFQGTGGTYKLQWSNGVRYKNFALGANLGFLFGQLNNSREVLFVDNTQTYVNDLTDEISVRGFVWNVGAQYRHEFKKIEKGEAVPNGKSLTIGAYGHTATPFTTNSTKLYRSIHPFYPSSAIDTFLTQVDVLEAGQLPSEYTVGIHYEVANKFKIGAEYGQTFWNEYFNEAKEETLVDARTFAIGGEYIPNYNSYNSFAKRMRYRLGFRYATDPRGFTTDLTQYSVSLGVGLPIISQRQQTFVNLALELGRFGSTESLTETFGKLTIGFTLNDNLWFFKRKFD